MLFLTHLEKWLCEFVHEVEHLGVEFAPNSFQLFLASLELGFVQNAVVDQFDLLVRLVVDHVLVLVRDAVNVTVNEFLHQVLDILRRMMNEERVTRFAIGHVDFRVLAVLLVHRAEDVFPFDGTTLKFLGRKIVDHSKETGARRRREFDAFVFG